MAFLNLHRRATLASVSGAIAILYSFVTLSAAAQWVGYPTAGVPRKADGTVDMAAPAPKLPDGKPDFSGIWTAGNPAKPKPGGDVAGNGNDIGSSRYMANMGADMKGGLPYQPWLIPIVKERTANLALDDPHIRCLPDFFLRAYGLPHMLKFLHKPGILVVLNEMNAGYRQVFTDARALPDSPTPAWQGYSTAKWSGDTLIIDTIGTRDDSWIDWNGSVVTEAAKIREEMQSPGFRSPRYQGDCRRPEGLHQALDGDAQTAHRRGRGADRRGLPRERAVREAHGPRSKRQRQDFGQVSRLSTHSPIDCGDQA